MEQTLTALVILYGVFITAYCIFLVSKVHKYKQMYLNTLTKLQTSTAEFVKLIDAQTIVIASLGSDLIGIERVLNEIVAILKLGAEPAVVASTPITEVENAAGSTINLSLYNEIKACLVRMDNDNFKKLTPTNKAKLKELLPKLKAQPQDEQNRIMDLILDYQIHMNTLVITAMLMDLGDSI